LERLRHAARTLADEPGQRVRLLEVRVVRVHDQRLRALELVLERPREALVPALRHARDVRDRLLLRRIEIEVPVRELEDAEVEVLVLDLVATEVLRGRGGGEQNEQSGEEEQECGR